MNKWMQKRSVHLSLLFQTRRLPLIFSLFSLIFLNLPAQGFAQVPARIKIETTTPQKVNLNVGKSVIIQSPELIKRVSLVTPEIADAMVLTPYQIYLTGKAPGITSLTLWDKEDKVTTVLDLEVLPDILRLKETIYRLFPDEKDINITATHDSITLSGSVSSSSSLSQILALAESYFPKKVINFLEVGGVHQVMLEVRVAEMSRSLMRRLGFNFSYLTSLQNLGLSVLGNLTRIPASNFDRTFIPEMQISDSITSIFRFVSHNTTWTVFVDALKENGLLKVLAEPTLITLSGKNAKFLAGGEFPIPVPQPGAGGVAVTIEYKPFGVGLNFTPTVLNSKKISIEVAPEVSELDFSRAVAIGGFVIPSVTTRRVSTTIELADGQSFAIAGLLKEDVREIVQKFPVLGDIPILGALFRSSSFQKNETELVVIVTPHLVKPLDKAKQTLPTDQFIEPDDFEFYLLGLMEGEGRGRPARQETKTVKGIKLEGNFGHIVPK